jgi:hypothetical protein
MIVTIPPAEAGRKSTYRTLIDRNGNMTKNGIYFYKELLEDPPNRGFDPGQQAMRAPRGKSEQILLRDGSKGTVRTWNHLTKEWRNTKLGKDFFGQRSDRWLINIPVKVHHKRGGGLNPWIRQGWAISTSIASLGEFSFPSTMPEAEQKAEVQRQYVAWKATLTRDAYGELIMPVDAYDACTLDEGEIEQYSKEEVRPEAAVGSK